MLQLIARSSLLLGAALLSSAGSSAAEPLLPPGPLALSPGGSSRVETAAVSCPTFSWSARDEIRIFEIVVFDSLQLSQSGLPHSDVTPALRTPVTSAVVPAGARSWTPSLESCPSAGGTYVWMVRGIGEGENTAWSPPRWFRTASEPSRDATAELMARLHDVLQSADAPLSSSLLAEVSVDAELTEPAFSVDGILEVGDLIADDGSGQGDIESDSQAASSALGVLRARRLQLNTDSSGTPGAVLVAESSNAIERGQLRLEAPASSQIEGRLTLTEVRTNWLEVTGAVTLDVPWEWFPPGKDGGQAGFTRIELTADDEVRLDTAGASCGNLPVRGVRLDETDSNQIGIRLLCGGIEGQP
jgi:hypothetical protein